MQPTLSELITIARQAGSIIREGFGTHITVYQKGFKDLVTEIDKRSEAILLDHIHSQHPGDSIITEESGFLPGDDGRTWYIDPLDGTLNFIHGVAHFCVSVAYARGGQLQLGVIYEPIRDECFAAEHGKGAWLNGQPMHVSQIASLEEALLGTGLMSSKRYPEPINVEYFKYFAHQSLSIRRMGAAAVDLAYLAAGRLDGYWDIQVNIWDIAAGVLIVQEAGGAITGMDGDPNFLQNQHPPYSLVAGGKDVHRQMLDVMQNGKNPL